MPRDIEAIMTTAPVIPELTFRRLDKALPIAQALVAGCLPVLEVTLRTDVGYAAIKALRDVPIAIVGVGSVLNPDHLKRAIDAGAAFAVRPGLTAPLPRRHRGRRSRCCPAYRPQRRSCARSITVCRA